MKPSFLPCFLRPAVLAGLFPLLLPSGAHAALFLHESFDYGTSGAIHGTAATGTGLTGSYNTTTTGTGGSATLVNGLAFSSSFFSTSGGALHLSMTSGSSTTTEALVSGVRLNAGTQTGTIYTSFLFNLSSNSINASADTIGSILSDTQNTNSNRRLGLLGDSGNSSDNFAVSYDAANSSQTGTAGTLFLATGTTYLMIGEYTNVGAAGGGTATAWFLTSAQYDAWFADGASLAGLSIHATGKTQRSATTQVFINNDTFLQFLIGEGSQDTTGTLAGTFDEIRFGTDLASVTVPIPEPSAVAALFGAAALGCAALRRRDIR